MDPPRLSPFVVPITTSPWIWPSNGKIIRGPLLNFWILLLMEVLGMYILLIAPNFPLVCFSFVVWEPEVMWSLTIALSNMVDVDLAYIYLTLYNNWWLYHISWNASWWNFHYWSHLICYFPLRSLLTGPPFQGPFPPFEGPFHPLEVHFFWSF